MNFYKKLDSFVAAGEYKAADEVITEEKGQYKGHHELLYYFDKGAVLQMLEEYRESTDYLEKAELMIEELYTKSATQHLSSFLTNDMNLPYEGEDFEQVMVNIMKALNFMYMGDFEGARVEARKVNNRLNLLADKYEEDHIYREDPFARYLSAIAYEAAGTRQELNGAYIDYKRCYRTYKKHAEIYGTQVPHSIKTDILRTAHALGRRQELAAYKDEFGIERFETYAMSRKRGEVILIIYDGFAPYKKSVKKRMPTKDKKGKKFFVSVAFPKFITRGYFVRGASLTAGGKAYTSSIAADIAKMAVKNLEHKNTLIAVKAVARATAKYLAARAISDNGKNQTLSILTGFYNEMSEQADTRSWRTLPARFHVMRVPLKKGEHSIDLNLDTAAGQRRININVDIKPGEKKVIPVFAFN
ncbi:MAG: COG3014 family protein [Candidatus Goldiibacteriota bacterium]